jgi:hypothetical protein
LYDTPLLQPTNLADDRVPAELQELEGLTVCAAMPDEPAAGHTWRLARLNGFPDLRTMMLVARELFAGSKVSPRLALLSRASSLDPLTYCHRHSMYPHIQCVIDVGTCDYPRRLQRQFLDFSSPANAERRPRFCRDCAAEDAAEHGFSWFRRAHQLTGVDWCLTHRRALEAVTNADHFHLNPHELANRRECESVKPAWPDLDHAPAFVHRYAEALNALGSSETFINRQKASRIIRTGSAVTSGVHKSPIRDLLQLLAATKPRGWNPCGREPELLRERLECLVECRLAVTNEYYALCIATLYESGAAGVDELIGPEKVDGPPPEPPPLRVPEQTAYEIRREQVEAHERWEAYARNADLLFLFSQSAYGEGRVCTNVSWWRVLPLLSGLPYHGAWKAIAEFADGASFATACRMHGAAVEDVEAVLRTEVRPLVDFVHLLIQVQNREAVLSASTLPEKVLHGIEAGQSAGVTGARKRGRKGQRNCAT